MLSSLTKRVHRVNVRALQDLKDPYRAGITEHAHNVLVRYTETGACCSYQAWSEGAVAQRFMMDEQVPDWLRLLVNIGKMGDHMQVSKESPPTKVLWIEMDKSQQLVRFVQHTT
jgi:hypothetical protein